MRIFRCNECKEKEEIIKTLHSERAVFYRKLKREIVELKSQLEPYLEPRTKMLYKVKVGDDIYEVVADYYHKNFFSGKPNTEFFLGDKRVADFSKVDEVIGFAVEEEGNEDCTSCFNPRCGDDKE